MVRQPSTIAVFRSHFQPSSSTKPIGRSKPNFMWSLLEKWERKFIQMVQVTWPRWPLCSKVLKTLKKIFSRTTVPIVLKLGMYYQGLYYYKVYINHDPWLSITYFTARSVLVPQAFEWGKLIFFFFFFFFFCYCTLKFHIVNSLYGF